MQLSTSVNPFNEQNCHAIFNIEIDTGAWH